MTLARVVVRRCWNDAATVVILTAGFTLGVVLVVAAAVTFAPWPFEAAAVGIGLVCGAVATLGTGDAVVGVCAAGLPVLALLVLKTMKQTLDEGAAARRRARPRRRPASASGDRAEANRQRRAA